MTSFFTNEGFLVILVVNVMYAWGLSLMVATGQLSVGQAGFAAVGAYASSWANAHLGWPIAASLPFGIAMAAAIAVPVAIGANRVRGLYLIIGTLAVGEIIVTALSAIGSLGGVQGYSGMEAVTLHQVYVAGAVVLILLFLLMRSPVGLALRSIRDDEDAAEALGVPTRVLKIGAVVIGAGITGLAGALYAHYSSFIQPDFYGVIDSFEIALFVLVGGADSLLGPAVGAFALTYLTNAFAIFTTYRGVIDGAFLLGVMILSPDGLITSARLRRVRMLLRAAVGVKAASFGPRVSGAERERGSPPLVPETGTGPVLALRSVTKRFGGLTALDAVDLGLRPGEVLGLIGPNGAGKSTLIDVASGLQAPSAGRVALGSEDVTGLPAHVRASRGVARTFQSVRLFTHLTVGQHLRLVHRNGTDGAAEATRWGLGGMLDRLPGELPLGVRRRVQIAQAMAAWPVALLLDEPSVGLDADGLAELRSLIGSARGSGTGVLLVDHNLDLVMDLADRVVVLDYGRVIAEGTPAAVRADPRVQDAYLGVRAGKAPR